MGKESDLRNLAKLLGDKTAGHAVAGQRVSAGAPAVEPLVGVLQDEDHKVRRGAVWALGAIGDVG